MKERKPIFGIWITGETYATSGWLTTAGDIVEPEQLGQLSMLREKAMRFETLEEAISFQDREVGGGYVAFLGFDTDSWLRGAS